MSAGHFSFKSRSLFLFQTHIQIGMHKDLVKYSFYQLLLTWQDERKSLTYLVTITTICFRLTDIYKH